MGGFEDFVAAEGASLLRFASALTGDRGTAEEVVQEVFLRASRRWAEISRTDAPRSYVRKMIVNEHVTWRRKWSRLIPRADVVLDSWHPDHAGHVVERDALDQHLNRLPARQRAVLVLRYLEGLGDDAIADLLGCTTGTVRSHASRALATLRVELAPQPDRLNEEV